MPTVYEAINSSIDEATTARYRVNKLKSKQVRGVDDVAMLKATAQTWFHTHRPIVVVGAPHMDLTTVDDNYMDLLNSTAKCSARSTYLGILKSVKVALIAVRSTALITPATIPIASTDDLAPDFSPLAGNQEMRDILTRRWHECAKCVKADAHLAAIVMMGGLLEALFVARANKITEKVAAHISRKRAKGQDDGQDHQLSGLDAGVVY